METIEKIAYKGKTKAQIIELLKAMDPAQPLEITLANGEVKTTTAGEELPIAEAMPAISNNFTVSSDVPNRLVIPTANVPATRNVECFINEVSGPLKSRTSDREYRMITYTTIGENATTEARPVSEGFYKAGTNQSKFAQGKHVIMTLQTAVKGKTQWINNTVNPPQLETHTQDGESVSNITYAVDDFANRAELVGNILTKYKDEPGLLNAMATVFAGQKLTS
nr:hypothetical protein [uncultured Flavobacterium sp.]